MGTSITNRENDSGFSYNPECSIEQALENTTGVINTFIDRLSTAKNGPLRKRLAHFLQIERGGLEARGIAETYIPELLPFGVFNEHACGTGFKIDLPHGPTVELGHGFGIKQKMNLISDRTIEFYIDLSIPDSVVTGFSVLDSAPHPDFKYRPKEQRDLSLWQQIRVGSTVDLTRVEFFKANQLYYDSRNPYKSSLEANYIIDLHLNANLIDVEYVVDAPSEVRIQYVRDGEKLLKQPLKPHPWRKEKDETLYRLFGDEIGESNLVDPDFWLILPRIIKPEHDDDLYYWKGDTDYPGLLVSKKIDIGQYLKPMSVSLKQKLPVLLEV